MYTREKDGKTTEVLVWSSNDYLGMGTSPVTIEAACEAAREMGAGAGGTRNISGAQDPAVIAAALASKPLRDSVARVLPIEPDNPVHALALVLAVLLFGTQVTSILFTNLSAAGQPPLTLGDLIAQEAPFLVLAAAGVGIFMRRNLPQVSKDQYRNLPHLQWHSSPRASPLNLRHP